VPANFLEALLGIHVDMSGLETGLKKAEQRVEESAKKMSGSFSLMAAGVAAAVAGVVIASLEKAIKTTADYGLEMEHLGARMGMTAQQAAVLTGMMERQGIGTNVAARAFQIMAMEAKQTSEAIDPFQTKMGKLLGTLRDNNGQVLNMSQVLDLARNRIAGAATDTEKLQLSQQLFGTRMGGQLLPMMKLTNEEWERQKKSVTDSLGPVNQAADAALQYKAASASLDQSLRGIELTIGTKLLPVLSEWINNIQASIQATNDWAQHNGTLGKSLSFLWNVSSITEWAKVGTAATLQVAEDLKLVEKGTTKAFIAKENEQNQQEKLKQKKIEEAEAQQEVVAGLQESEKLDSQRVSIAGKQVQILQKQFEAGVGGVTQKEIELAVQEKLAALETQRLNLEKDLEATGLTPDTELAIQEKLAQNKLESAEVVANKVKEQYKDEEAMLRANGNLNLTTEIQLLQTKLADEKIVGNERLKIEGDLYEKRKQYLEEATKVGVDLGIFTVDQEIAYRKQKSAELLGKGDVIGAGQELVKARDLALQQADQQMNFVKKLHTVSLQEEIDFQKQKLEAVKGNAQKEMEVISQIADLDKKLYDERLQFGLTYTQTIVDQYNKIEAAARKSGEVQTFEQAKVDSERKLVESTREARQVLSGGGTAEQRQASIDFAQFVNKQIEQMQSLGKEVSDTWRDAGDTAQDILKAASGGEEVRAPGGPSPEVGSILSPMEGLATQGLARGSDIPRLDTSFTDLATRLRDVLNTNVSNLINFGTVVGDVTKKVASLTGSGINPGAVGPGGSIISAGTPGTLPNTGGGTSTVPAGGTPTVGPGGVPVQPSQETGIGGRSQISDQLDQLVAAIRSGNKDLIDQLNTQSVANAESLRSALSQAQAERANATTNVSVSLEPGTGDLIVSRIEKELQP
jgi:hypothetical protein